MNWDRLKNRFDKLSSEIQDKVSDQFFRIVNVESISLDKDVNDNFEPFLKKGQVVKIKFVGMGTVIDRPHYAVVWDAYPKNEHVVVIPLTSKVRQGKSYFEIGPIDGLKSASHVIKSNQPQSVSRKSIQIWTKKNKNGENIIVELEDWQLKKTEELFRISQLKEPSLIKVLTQFISLKVPTTDVSVYFDDLNKPVHYFIMDNALHYKTYQNEPVKSIELVNLGIRSKERKELLNNLFSDSPAVQSVAEGSIKLKLEELQASIEN